MNKTAAACSAILLLLCCSAVHAQWPIETYGVRSVWEVELGTRILDRPGTETQFPLVKDAITLDTVFDAEEASDLDTSAGAQFRFSRATCYDTTWEVHGYIHNWEVNESFAGRFDAPLFTPAGVPGTTELTAFDYDYDSELFNIELNFKRAVQPGFTLMLGPRFMCLEEEVGIDANFFAPNLGNFLQLDIQARARNPLAGLGIGAEFRKPLTRYMFFVGTIKGGIFSNNVASRITVASTLLGNPLGTQTFIDDSDFRTAGIGEFSARLHYDIAPGTVSVYAGYDAMWLDGVAVAPAQVLVATTPPGPPFILTGTTVFAHGLVVGTTVRF